MTFQDVLTENGFTMERDWYFEALAEKLSHLGPVYAIHSQLYRHITGEVRATVTRYNDDSMSMMLYTQRSLSEVAYVAAWEFPSIAYVEFPLKLAEVKGSTIIP